MGASLGAALFAVFEGWDPARSFIVLPPQLAVCPLARSVPRWFVLAAGGMSSRRTRGCAAALEM